MAKQGENPRARVTVFYQRPSTAPSSQSNLRHPPPLRRPLPLPPLGHTRSDRLSSAAKAEHCEQACWLASMPLPPTIRHAWKPDLVGGAFQGGTEAQRWSAEAETLAYSQCRQIRVLVFGLIHFIPRGLPPLDSCLAVCLPRAKNASFHSIKWVNVVRASRREMIHCVVYLLEGC